MKKIETDNRFPILYKGKLYNEDECDDLFLLLYEGLEQANLDENSAIYNTEGYSVAPNGDWYNEHGELLILDEKELNKTNMIDNMTTSEKIYLLLITKYKDRQVNDTDCSDTYNFNQKHEIISYKGIARMRCIVVTGYGSIINDFLCEIENDNICEGEFINYYG